MRSRRFQWNIIMTDWIRYLSVAVRIFMMKRSNQNNHSLFNWLLLKWLLKRNWDSIIHYPIYFWIALENKEIFQGYVWKTENAFRNMQNRIQVHKDVLIQIFSVLQEKIRFLFDVLLLERLTLHRRAIFHSKPESSVELQKIHVMMFGEEQDSSHASKTYLG